MNVPAQHTEACLNGGTLMNIRKISRHVFLTMLAAALTLSACNVGAAPPPTLDVSAVNTAIVGTTIAQFSAQFTQTALAVPQATNTPLPTDTPQTLPTFALVSPTTDSAAALPTISFAPTATIEGVASPLPAFTQIVAGPTKAPLGDACNNSAFEGDVTIPDGTVIQGGINFQKIWKIRNTGSCTWDDGYSLVYVGGSTPNLDPYTFNFVNSQDFVAGGSAINIPINLTSPCTPGKYEGHWRMRNDQGYFFGTLLSVYIEVKEKSSGCK